MKYNFFINKIRYSSRLKKLEQFMNFFNPTPEEKILEVGVASKEYSSVDNFLIKNYPYRNKITALGIEDMREFKQNFPEVLAIQYDGKKFPFFDNEFDLVHSNAVIEHVGDFSAQENFLKEMYRVSKRGGMITMPNKFFPIEIHTRVPLLHIINYKIFERFCRFIGKDWATGNYMNLLSLKELKFLIKKVNISNYTILKNKLLGFSMTFSLLWRKEQ